jgi:glucose/arabinose dehydrogenase
MRVALRTSLCVAAALGLCCASPSRAQVKEPQVFERVQGHVNEPTKLVPTEELLQRLQLPAGFAINKFADGLVAPRMLAIGEDGAVYVTRRHPHNDVWLLRDMDGDGSAEERRVVAEIQHVHGIAIHAGRVYLAAVRNFYVANIESDGSFSTPQALYSDLPDAGQHPNRTVKVSPDGRLFLSVGSTNNAAPEPNPESATMLLLQPDGTGRSIYAKGLRNTIGFDWHPTTGELWGMDHGIDWLGDLEQREELNLIVQGGDYGWPFIYDDRKFNMHQNPQETTGLTREEYAARTAPPILGLEPHSAPMEMLFYRASQFPEAYRNQAFVAMHGSWNRARPVGYSVVMIRFEKGQPVQVQDFLTGFLTDGRRSQFGRPCGMAVGRDGSLFISDDSGGVVYRVTYQAAQ